MTEPRPSIDELVVGDEPEAWTAAGFTVDGDTCRIGTVRVRLAGRAGGSGITAWSLRDLAGRGRHRRHPHHLERPRSGDARTTTRAAPG